MQTAKSLLTLLALSLCVVSVSQAGPDNEAQAKAREALRKKMAELEGQPAAAAPAAPAAEAKPAPPVEPKEPKPAKPAKPAEPAVSTVTFAEVSSTSQMTAEQAERLREATRQKISELNTPAPAGKPAAEAKPAPAKTTFEPLPVPPPAVPASKEARLADLLKKYKADEITPEQYHTERAKILAEP